MTTKGSIQNRVDALEDALTYDEGAALFAVPPTAQPGTMEPQPDGEITVNGEVVVPHHLPRGFRRGPNIPMITYRQVLLSWVFMPDEILRREIERRETHDEPIPPIVNEVDV
jgi:hypothetical protein